MRRLWVIALSVLVTPWAGAQTAPDNVGHARHTHHHNPKHPTEAPTPARFTTSRMSDVVLPLPQEKDAFTFVVFGDRTGGPVDGVKVLADAVRDTNLLEPDLVMTVGDLINGYNQTEQWMEQMREYKGVMDELRCPWFPVAGNHDVYWRGPNRPVHEHDANYEMHFGPLWYAFEHKKCWFIALYSDETNPDTGEKTFSKPENHRMSEEQFAWLASILDRAKGADHVFIFLHHPRWIGSANYGDSWERVHKLLVSAGNVTAVFAGHIHRMRYDPKDGIEYVTLATVGGGQSGTVPQAGWLHHYNVITVRKQQVAMAAFPVGEAMDVREITGEFADQCARMHNAAPVFGDAVTIEPDGAVRQRVRVSIQNPTTREADVTVALESGDSRWMFAPDHDHRRVKAGESGVFEFTLRRPAGSADAYMRPLEAVVDADVLMPGQRYALPTRRVPVPLNTDSLPRPTPGTRALEVSGAGAVKVASERIALPDGPLTLEAWFKGEEFAGRTGLVCKTESADYGVFVSNGRPEFYVYLGSAYVAIAGAADSLRPGQWHHVAGVFDGSEVRLYLDGALVAKKAGAGARRTNRLPLYIGADVDADGTPTSFFRGRIGAVRLMSKAAYAGERFTPSRRLAAEDGTVFLTNMDGTLAGRLWFDVPDAGLGEFVGPGTLVEAE